MDQIIGQSIGRYQILERLGEGGMATVYRARDTRLEREVAVKLIRRSAFPAEMLDRILARFEREAKSLARLTHPGIVRVYDCGEHDGAPYLVLELCGGGDLRQRLQGKPIDWREAIQLILPIARALRFSHQQGVIHRDVKPSNIIFNSSGEPMLSDFGIAKILEYDDAATLTGTGVGIGTPGYMAPEQWMGETSPQSDQYGLGVVLYELLTGRKPYEADTPAGILIKQTNHPLPTPRQFTPTIPPAVETALLKALDRDPAGRYADMDAFIKAFEGLPQLTALVDAPTADNYKTVDMAIIAAASGDAPHTLTSADRATTVAPLPDTKRPNLKMIFIGVAALVVMAGTIWGALQLSKNVPALLVQAATPTNLPTSTRVASKTHSPTFTPTIIQSFTPTPTALPTALGGGGRIGFVSNRTGKSEIYTMRPDGTNIIQITDKTNLPEDREILQASWSPDGRKIAYILINKNDNSRQIYIMNSDGSDVSTPAKNVCVDCFELTWFPDGKRIYFWVRRADLGRKSAYIMNLDGLDLSEFTSDTLPRPLDLLPCSPDDSKCVFDATGNAFGTYDWLGTFLWVINKDLSNPIRLTPHFGNYMNPIWSTEGNEIYYVKSIESFNITDGWKYGGEEIHSIKPDGNDDRIITKLPFNAGVGVDLSPDGKKFLQPGAFQQLADGSLKTEGMYVINVDGSGLVKLSDQDVYNALWSPDGAKILFAGSSYNLGEDIFLINPDGTGLVNLTNQPASYSDLTWLPAP